MEANLKFRDAQGCSPQKAFPIQFYSEICPMSIRILSAPAAFICHIHPSRFSGIFPRNRSHGSNCIGNGSWAASGRQFARPYWQTGQNSV